MTERKHSLSRFKVNLGGSGSGLAKPNFGNNNSMDAMVKVMTLKMFADQMSQQKQQTMEQRGGVLTGGNIDGMQYQTDAGQDFTIRESIRRKAAEDALRTKTVLPLLDDLEQSYQTAYADIINSGGIQGGLDALGAFGKGVMLRGNPTLRTLIGKLKQYRPAIVKAAGDSGNFSQTEQSAAGESLPELGPNFKLSNLFLPDDPVQGLNRIQSLKQLYQDKMNEQLHAAETGEIIGGYQEYAARNFGYAPSVNTQPSNSVTAKPSEKAPSQTDKRTQYNELRAAGVSAKDARQRLGL